MEQPVVSWAPAVTLKRAPHLVHKNPNGNTAWGHQFIQRNAKYLYPENKKDAIALASAFCFFNDKKFEKGLSVLMTIQNKNHAYNVRKRSLEIRCRYELILNKKDEFESLENNLIAFETWLRDQRKKKEMSVKKNKAYTNFVGIVRKILKLTLQIEIDPDQKDNLHGTVKNLSPLSLKPWLLEKIESLS